MKADLQKKLKYINNPDSLSHGKHRGLNITETFLEKSEVGREYLGAHLAKGINYSTRRLIQAITDTFPTGCNKLRWKMTDNDNCTCGSVKETMSHLQTTCPLWKEARIKAHHMIWNSLFEQIEMSCSSTFSVGFVCTQETVISKYSDRPSEWQQDGTWNEWHSALARLNDLS